MTCTNTGTAYWEERTIIYNNGRSAARAGHKAKGKEEAGSEEGRRMKWIEHRNAKTAHHTQRERERGSYREWESESESELVSY